MSIDLQIGLFEWFDANKGFGMIKTSANNEVFFHNSNWRDVTYFKPDNEIPVVFESAYVRNKNSAGKFLDVDFSLLLPTSNLIPHSLKSRTLSSLSLPDF